MITLSRNATTFPRVLAAEWTKLTGLTSTVWLAVGTVVGASSLAHVLGLFVRPGDTVAGMSLATSGTPLAQLGVLVLGVLIGSGEFSTGAATTTFAAVPRRLPVLAAQVFLVVGLALATATAALVASFLVTTGARAEAVPGLDVGHPETVRVAVGFVLHLTGVAVLGVGCGALLRRPGAALMTVVVLLLVVDPLLVANPGPVTDTVRALLPTAGTRMFESEAGLAVLAGGRGPDLGAWGGGVVLAAWTIAVLGAAAYRLRRHDVT